VRLKKLWLSLAFCLVVGRWSLADEKPDPGSAQPTSPMVIPSSMPSEESPDDAPLPLQSSSIGALIWQGPALDAGPGGSDEAVEYGQARLLPTVDLGKKFPKVTLWWPVSGGCRLV